MTDRAFLIVASLLSFLLCMALVIAAAHSLDAPRDPIIAQLRDADAIQEQWGMDRVREALQLPKAPFRGIHISHAPAVKPHVCGHVGVPNPYWKFEFVPFIVNGTTGNVYVDDNTLEFYNLWSQRCSQWSIDHEAK